MKAQTIEPTTRITDCLTYSSPVEIFFDHSIAVSGQSSFDQLFFGFREKFGGIRVVLNEPVRCCGNDDSSNSFLNHDVNVESQVLREALTRMKIHRHPLLQTIPLIFAIP